MQFHAVAVIRPHNRGGSSFCGYRVGTHHLVFGDHRDVQAAPALPGGLNGSPQTGQSGPEDDEIVT
ncbi:MAG: hypothetical protein BWY83_01319 [bacterium ADurb.Bin478]|nr:MAG: hypothetical protein BWY83_01319 [bacterium ADurb.Bin478]